MDYEHWYTRTTAKQRLIKKGSTTIFPSVYQYTYTRPQPELGYSQFFGGDHVHVDVAEKFHSYLINSNTCICSGGNPLRFHN